MEGVFFTTIMVESILRSGQQGIREGEGKWIQANGNVYSGNFRQDKPVGQGTANLRMVTYTGNWSNEFPNGKGTYYTASGERYEGNFLNGKYDGQGSVL